MIKNNKGKCIATSLVILLPMVVGMIIWKHLPPKIATHWNFEGVVNGWSSKAFAVFGLPLFLLLVHWVCLWVTAKDPGNRHQNPKLQSIVLWICPLVSLFCAAMIYATALGYTLNLNSIVIPLIGILFILIGNYMPKCKRNCTIGIKLPWTLRSEENWHKTHRLAGKVWVIGGFLLLVCLFIPAFLLPYVMVGAIVMMVAIPTIYSYAYYRNKEKPNESN